jgi:hypothetical protein
MKSRIYLSEKVSNKDRKFGSILEYYPSRIENSDGGVMDALFTANELEVAMKRAETNPEDVPGKTFLEGIFRKGE